MQHDNSLRINFVISGYFIQCDFIKRGYRLLLPVKKHVSFELDLRPMLQIELCWSDSPQSVCQTRPSQPDMLLALIQ